MKFWDEKAITISKAIQKDLLVDIFLKRLL
jgi:hypothetical protein